MNGAKENQKAQKRVVASSFKLRPFIPSCISYLHFLHYKFHIIGPADLHSHKIYFEKAGVRSGGRLYEMSSIGRRHGHINEHTHTHTHMDRHTGMKHHVTDHSPRRHSPTRSKNRKEERTTRFFRCTHSHITSAHQRTHSGPDSVCLH